MTGAPDNFDLGLIPLAMGVSVDRDLGAVKIADQTGKVVILLAPDVALDLCLRLVAACGRLRGVDLGREPQAPYDPGPAR